MSTLFVVDASVAMKWVVAEPGSDAASRLLDQSANGSLALVAPEHLLGEVGNGLRKRVAQGVLSAESALEALDDVVDAGLEFVTGADRWARCLRGALNWGVTAYDALYVSVALDLDAQLVTADERLLAAGQKAGLPVHALGDPPPDVPQMPTPRHST